MSGIQVAGLVSCSRIFQFRNDLPAVDAPFRPISCLMPALPSSASALVSLALGSVAIATIGSVRRSSTGRAARWASGVLSASAGAAHTSRSSVSLIIVSLSSQGVSVV